MKEKMKKIKNQNGFTLVEVLVVVVVLGLIIWLITSQFADPVNKSKIRTSSNGITRAFSSIEQAALDYALENPKATTIAQLVTAGKLKNDPAPPEFGKSSAATSGTYAYQLTTTLGGSNVVGFGGAGIDTVVTIDQLDSDVCTEINRKQGITGIPAAIEYTKNVQCYGASPNYTAVMPIYIQ